MWNLKFADYFTDKREKVPKMSSARHYKPPVPTETSPVWFFDLSQGRVGGRPVVSRATSNSPMYKVPSEMRSNRAYNCYQPFWTDKCV